MRDNRAMSINDQSLDLLAAGKQVLEAESDAIRAMSLRMGPEFPLAVELLHSCSGRVIVSGMGKSGLVGKKIAATLASTGTPAYFVHPAEAMHGDLGMVTAQDAVLALSNSGETEEVLAIIPYLKRFGVKLVCMVGNIRSTLARSADISLDVGVDKEACPMDIVPTSSTTATLAMGDALAVALLIKRGFCEDDFAAFHPKGALGKRLLLRVAELMHAGADLPRVSADAPILDALVEVSSKRLGLTTVLDAQGQVVGMLTDGDIRRGIERAGEGFFKSRTSEVMSRNPKSIRADELASRALALMQEHSITALLTTDEAGSVVGIVHIHDILKAGIV